VCGANRVSTGTWGLLLTAVKCSTSAAAAAAHSWVVCRLLSSNENTAEQAVCSHMLHLEHFSAWLTGVKLCRHSCQCTAVPSPVWTSCQPPGHVEAASNDCYLFHCYSVWRGTPLCSIY
jgi:hypothetical protein